MKKKLTLSFVALALSLTAVWGGLHQRAVRSAFTEAVEPALHAVADRSFVRQDSQTDDETNDDETFAGASNYDLSAHQTLSRVILLIRENYVEPDRIKPYDMFLAALDYIQKTIPEVMVDEHQAPARITIWVDDASQAFELGKLDELWEVTMALRDIFRFLQTKITDPVQRRDIEYAAINGMLSTLDPHSILLKPESFDEVKMTTKGEFGGLGIVISIRDGALTIIAPIEGTPASAVGLKSRDKIVQIGEEGTINMGLDEAVQRLRGRAGSPVTISVLRKGWTEPKRFTLVRAVIKIESVTSKLLEDKIGYIRIKSFQGNTYDDLETHLEKLKAQNSNQLLKGLILDLRNNPGGLLDQAILISDRFIDRGPLVITVGEGNRKREVKQAHDSGNENQYPIAVLINGGSASASEIVSGALKNHNRAFIVGQQSFGKGSVQVLYDFKDRSALKLTIAQYLTPGDLSIQSVGVVPDIIVSPSIVEKDGLHLFIDDDSPREKDLEKHLEQHGANNLTSTSVKIYHLMPKEKDEASDGNTTDSKDVEDSVNDVFHYDFETRLAHDVLIKAQTQDRQAILKQAWPVLQDRYVAEDQTIAKRFQELSVDWERDPSYPTSGAMQTSLDTETQHAPDASIKIATDSNKQMVLAGETITLTATVQNHGNKPLYRLYAVSQSDNPLFKNLEFAFGKVLPGQTRSWDMKIKIPKEMPARADAVTVQLGDARGLTQVQSGETFVCIQERNKPRFAYSYRIDDQKPGAKGNGDGVLQVGETVNFRIDVQNLGSGVAEDVTVTLKNLSGKELSLSKGRQKLGALAVGERKTAELKFSIPAKLPEDVAKVRLLIYDGNLGTSIAETLQLPLSPKRKLVAQTARLKPKKAAPVLVYAGASEKMPILATLSPHAVVYGVATMSDWWKIKVSPDVFGYVQNHEVVGTSLKATGANQTHQMAPTSAPDIDLSVVSMVTNDTVVPLHAHIQDARKLKDMFVFVNDKKIFYKSLESLKQTATGVQIDVDVSLPLKAGSNTIAVIAREDEDMIGRRFFGIYRREDDKHQNNPSLKVVPDADGVKQTPVPASNKP